MDDGAAANVDRHVADSGSAAVENKIARLQGGYIHGRTVSGLGGGLVRQGDAEVCEDRHDKSGAARAVCQACSAVHIRISHKLAGIIRDGLTGR